jgi:hypothetical protein
MLKPTLSRLHSRSQNTTEKDADRDFLLDAGCETSTLTPAFSPKPEDADNTLLKRYVALWNRGNAWDAERNNPQSAHWQQCRGQ